MNRRTLLSVASSTALTSLAGCSSILSTTNDSKTTAANQQRGVIDDASIEDTTLVVSLSSDTDVEKVNVVGPDGSVSLGSKSVPTGSTQVTFDIFQSVPRGSHRVVAIAADEVVGETSFELTPGVEIDRIATRFQTDSVSWPRSARYEAYLELTNSGSTPQQVIYLSMQGVPISWEKSLPSSSSGLQTLDTDKIENLVLQPGETRRVFTYKAPFYTGTTDFECGTTTTATVTLTTAIGEPIEETYQLVTEERENKDCKMLLQSN